MARKNDFLRTASGVVRSRVTEKVTRAMEESRQETLVELAKDVFHHPVSKAISSHSDHFMPKPGSLFGFLGFSAQRNPIEELVAFLRSPRAFQLRLSRQTIGRTTGLIGSMKGPTDDDFVEAGITSEWGDGRSWPEMLETKVPGLSTFLAKDGYGRSEEGAQIKNRKLWDNDELSEIKYLTPILQKAKRRFIDKIKRKSATR